MKNSNGTIGNRTRDLPTCSAMPPLLSAQQTCVFCTVGGMQTDASPVATRHCEGAGFLYETRQIAIQAEEDPGRGRTDGRPPLIIVDRILKMALFNISIKIHFNLLLSA
jgi:hypothetical protein